MQSGRLDEAEDICDQIITMAPKSAMAYYQKGRIALAKNNYKLAIERINIAIGIDSHQANFHSDLGFAHAAIGNFEEARRCYTNALALTPDDPLLFNNIGTTYKNQGRISEAIDNYQTAIDKDSKCKIAYSSLAKLFKTTGELDKATEVLRKAIEISPDDLDASYFLADIQRTQGHFQAAIEICNRILSQDRNYPGVYNLLGLCMSKLGKKNEAIECYRKASEREPDSPQPYNNLGREFLYRNDLPAAIGNFRKALEIKPDHAKAHSNLLLTLNYIPEISQEEFFRESLLFGEQQNANIIPAAPDFQNEADKDKTLKIGYVSPDFRNHSVTCFFRRIPQAHDRKQVEVFCYSDVSQPDDITRLIANTSDHWRSIAGFPDEEVISLITNDGIDILVDLAGHTANNRLPVFNHKPAPVQINWLGYPNTTGLRSMDYRITDEIADPPGITDKYYTEQLLRLPHGFLCYQVDDPIPQVTPPPVLNRGYITFGSFNNINKVSDDTARAWSGILKNIPNSRLILKSIVLTDEEMQLLVDKFTQHGLDRHRIDLLGEIPGKTDHLKMYSQIDICLDPFPYNGTTTTCEALWMGVPVINLLGDRHASRVGASILNQAGLENLVADDVQSYIQLAQSLASDISRLTTFREQMRAHLLNSELMDVDLFVRDLETAFRDAWCHWCDTRD